MVPFGDFGVGEEGVVAAEEAGADAAVDAFVGGVVGAGWVGGELPVAVLAFERVSGCVCLEKGS